MDGDLTFDKKYEDTIRIVNLEHETLKLMRRTWATIALGGCFKVVDGKRACQDKVWREEIIERSLITLRISARFVTMLIGIRSLTIVGFINISRHGNINSDSMNNEPVIAKSLFTIH